MYHVKEDRRQKKSAELITKSLFEILKEKPLDEITISEVAERIAIGRATFYRSFDTVYDVVLYAVDTSIEEFKQSIIKYRKKHPENRGAEYIIPTLEYWKSKEWLVRALVNMEMRSLLLNGLKEIDSVLFEEQFEERYRPFARDLRCSVWLSMIVFYIMEEEQLTPNEIVYIMNRQFKNTLKGN